LAFIKALSIVTLSPAVLAEPRTVLATREWKKIPLMHAGLRNTFSEGISATTHRAGKRKAGKLYCSGDYSEPAKRRPVPGAGPARLPATSSVSTSYLADCGGR
jgi:hypothetical protein